MAARFSIQCFVHAKLSTKISFIPHLACTTGPLSSQLGHTVPLATFLLGQHIGFFSSILAFFYLRNKLHQSFFFKPSLFSRASRIGVTYEGATPMYMSRLAGPQCHPLATLAKSRRASHAI
jgi:hypothetical protein